MRSSVEVYLQNNQKKSVMFSFTIATEREKHADGFICINDVSKIVFD